MTSGRAFEREGARLLLRKRIFRGALVLGGGISYAAVFLLASGRDGSFKTSAAFTRPPFSTITSCERGSIVVSSLSETPEACQNVRTRRTPADLYFERHRTIPKPRIMHATLDSNSEKKENERGILVIGDVHGCFEELKLLHKAALKENGNVPFRYVVLVGDLCNKGPDSAKVIRYVREQPNWFAVRGNHDNAALRAALGDSTMRKKKKYKWVSEGERRQPNNGDTVALSDDDIMWLSELPYTITIPSALLNLDNNSNEDSIDTTIVHAGLVPGQVLEDQSIETMVTIRKLDPVVRKGEVSTGDHSYYVPHGMQVNVPENGAVRDDPVPWASVWTGPQQVIFGHDAKRGLQTYESNWATGLDTGAVYGKKLTGIILPSRRIVQVDSLKAHSPIK